MRRLLATQHLLIEAGDLALVVDHMLGRDYLVLDARADWINVHDNHLAKFCHGVPTIFMPPGLPDTVAMAMRGRPLTDVIDLKGLVTRPTTRIRRAEPIDMGWLAIELEDELEPLIDGPPAPDA